MFKALDNNPRLFEQMVPADADSYVGVALVARGLVFGGVAMWRRTGAEAFSEQDEKLLVEIASRAALSIDNARRYTREHAAVVALQRSLLPTTATDTSGARTEGVYVPTVSSAGVGGDWFDVIPLSSARIALVVGDIMGHGLRATAAMGRLRAAVHTLADLDLPPDELLAHLDDIVCRLGDDDPDDPLSATCLYAVWDPVTRRCSLASAGQPPPALVRPSGTVEFLDVSPGPPLGVGGVPFEMTHTDLPPGSVLALYTDGLIEYGNDIDAGMTELCERLVSLHASEEDLGESAHRIVCEICPTPSSDDIALLLARIRCVPSDNVATWEIPADPAAVAVARALVSQQLTTWALADTVLTAELVVSELVTNAIRYGSPPIVLRLIREHTLICEVSDTSSTQPRLRRARWNDEGGRGLFLIAQMTDRWGSRYTPTGKTIWTEQPLTGTPF